MSGGAIKRLMKELELLKNNPSDFFSAVPEKDNIFHWKAVIFGPPNTPYEGGKFSVNIYFTKDYPFKPPKIYFETKIFHSQIHSDGSLCPYASNILNKNNWSPAIFLTQLFKSIYDLLKDPKPGASGFCGYKDVKFNPEDKESINKIAKEWTKKNAMG